MGIPSEADAVESAAEMDVALCIVCDIRSFTEMQTRVHDLIFESLESKNLKDKVRTLHGDYVKKTQDLAHRKLTGPIDKWQEKNGKIPYVIKPTGDGYMIAVSMKCNGDKYARMDLAEDLIRSAYSLTLESDIAHQAGFGLLTSNFLSSCGDALGFNKDNIDREGVEFNDHSTGVRSAIKNTRFRVAAAASLGFATFVDPYNIDSSDPVFDPYLPQLADISGYGINLAFRLCDEAGRGYEDGRPTSPTMLLDRRIGRALVAHNEEKYAGIDPPYRIRPWSQQLRLRGFEERWAYYLVRNGSTTVPHAL